MEVLVRKAAKTVGVREEASRGSQILYQAQETASEQGCNLSHARLEAASAMPTPSYPLENAKVIFCPDLRTNDINIDHVQFVIRE